MTDKKRVLLIVDIQNGFCPGGNLAVHGGDEIVPIINAMTASGYYDMVVASQDWHPAGHGSFASSHPGKAPFETGELGGKPQMLWPDHCVQGTVDADFHPDLDMSRVQHVQRKGEDMGVDSYSAFRDNEAGRYTGLADYLNAHNIGVVDVCGLATDYCVKFSALDAKELLAKNVTVRFVQDASRGITPEGVSDALKEMKRAGIEIVDSAVATSATGYRSEYGFGELFHTALRKGVDTKWSVVLWNYLYIMMNADQEEVRKEQVWPHFLRSCERSWRDGMKPSEAAIRWAKLDEDHKIPDTVRGPANHVAHAFRAMILLCDKQTWDELDSTLEYWVDREEQERAKRTADR